MDFEEKAELAWISKYDLTDSANGNSHSYGRRVRHACRTRRVNRAERNFNVILFRITQTELYFNDFISIERQNLFFNATQIESRLDTTRLTASF